MEVRVTASRGDWIGVGFMDGRGGILVGFSPPAHSTAPVLPESMEDNVLVSSNPMIHTRSKSTSAKRGHVEGTSIPKTKDDRLKCITCRKYISKMRIPPVAYDLYRLVCRAPQENQW